MSGKYKKDVKLAKKATKLKVEPLCFFCSGFVTSPQLSGTFCALVSSTIKKFQLTSTAKLNIRFNVFQF